MRILKGLPLFFLCCLPLAYGGSGPKPSPKQTVTLTCGGQARTLNATAPSVCLTRSSTVLQGRVGSCTAGSYVQWPNTCGDPSVHWSAQDSCGPQPAPLSRHADCPAGTEGSGWTQSAAYTSAPAPSCWVLGPYQPTEPPAGVCTAIPPPPGGALNIDFGFVDRSSPEYAAFLSFANRTDEADPQTLAYAYRMTQSADYCARAVPQVAGWMANPGEIAGDSYLQIDQYLAPAMMVREWCPNVSSSQRAAWLATAKSLVDAVWTQGCAGWGVCDLQNNYHAHFVRATVYVAIESGEQSRIDFALGKLNEQLAALNASQPGGGSLEGKGYQYAWKWLNDAALVVRDSGFGDVFNANGYLSANTLEWVHATAPDMQHFAPIGSQPRDSAASIYDYQAGSVREGCYQTTNVAVRAAAGYWTAKIPLEFYRANTWDDLWACPTSSTPPALVYNAPHVAIYARTAWASTATYLVAVTYDRSQSHAHSEFGEVLYWRNGAWGVTSGQSLSHSGINGEPPDWSVRAKSVVGFSQDGTLLRPLEGFPVVSNYTENQTTGAMHATLDMSANYAGMGVSKWQREIDFANGVATVADSVVLANSSLTAGQQWIVPGSSAPTCSGQVCSSGNVKFTVVSPTPMQFTVKPLSSFDSDFDRGGYVLTIACSGGCKTVLSAP